MLAAEAWADLGKIPSDIPQKIRARAKFGRLCRLRSNDILFKPVGKKAIEPLLQRRVVADKADFLLLTRLRARP